MWPVHQTLSLSTSERKRIGIGCECADLAMSLEGLLGGPRSTLLWHQSLRV